MKGILLALTAATVFALAAFTFGFAASPAAAHRSNCHRHHTCPSDHATYRWGPRRLLCVKPDADEMNSSFRIRVRYRGRTYYCRR